MSPHAVHFFSTSLCCFTASKYPRNSLVLRDNQLHPTVLYKGHLFYLRIIKALPVTGLAHPRFIEISASRTWRHFPSE